MEIIAVVAVLTPLVALLLLTLAVTVHFFWLSREGRWPPDQPPTAAGPRRQRPAGGVTTGLEPRRRSRAAG